MSPIGAILAGLVLLALGALVLRSFGPGYRIGRLLAATPRSSIEEALDVARSGRPLYVRVDGRIDAEDEFLDEHRRPLVVRRVRLSVRRNGRWETIDDRYRSVPFIVREGLAEIGVAHESIGDGLVVLDRESVGVAGDAPEHVPSDLSADTPVKLRVNQLSSVEHVAVLGVPALGEAGAPVIGPGMGRPLIVSALERDEAMQLLSSGRRGRARIAAVLLAAGLAFLGIGLAWGAVELIAAGPVARAAELTPAAAEPTPAGAANPTPTAAPASAPAGEDTRSSGEGAGAAGEPLLAIGAVVGLGVVVALVTLVYVRLSGGRRDAT